MKAPQEGQNEADETTQLIEHENELVINMEGVLPTDAQQVVFEHNDDLSILRAFWRVFRHAAPFSISRLVEVGGTFYLASLIAQEGEEALAASALIFPVQTVITNTAVVALYAIGGKIGENFQKNPDKADQYFKNGMIIAAAMGSTVGLSNALITPVLLKLCRQPDKAVKIFSEFNTGFSVSLLPVLLYNVEQQFALGTKRRITVPVATTLSVLLTSGTSYILVRTSGVTGLGWAAVISNTVNATVFGLYLLLTTPKHHLLAKFRSNINLKIIFELVRIGLPFAIEAGTELITKEILNLFIGSLGIAYLGAAGIANRSRAFVITPLFTIGASGMYVGKNEVNDPTQTKRAWKLSKIVFASSSIGLTYAMLGAVTLWAGGQFKFLINPFLTDETRNNPVIINTAKDLLLIFGLLQIPNSIRYSLAGGLYALDQTKITMFTGFVTLAVLGLPISYLVEFPADLGVNAMSSVTGGMYILGIGVLASAFFWKVRKMPSSQRSTNDSVEDAAETTSSVTLLTRAFGLFKTHAVEDEVAENEVDESEDHTTPQQRRWYHNGGCTIV